MDEETKKRKFEELIETLSKTKEFSKIKELMANPSAIETPIVNEVTKISLSLLNFK